MNFLHKFLEYGLNGNVWIWFHIMAGGFFAKIALIWFDKTETMVIILVSAILWEVIEYYWDGKAEGMVDIYGSIERWFYDSLGDVIGAVLMAIIVLM